MDGQEFGHNDKQREQPLAQGKEYHSSSQGNEYPEGDEYDAVEGMEGSEGERGIIGDTYRKFRGKSPKKPGEDPSLGSFIFGKLQGAVQDISSEIGKRMDGRNQHSNVNAAVQAYDSMPTSTSHRYGSFATQRTGSDAKWFVDGCGYFWAVSEALEHATQSIWILDCEYPESLCISMSIVGLASFPITFLLRSMCMCTPRYQVLGASIWTVIISRRLASKPSNQRVLDYDDDISLVTRFSIK